VGFLPGRLGQHEPFGVFPAYGIPNRKKLKWVVRAAAGTCVKLVARSQRAGTVRADVTL
jgi:hypothetical protein